MLSVANYVLIGPWFLLFSLPKAAAAFASMLPPLPFWITDADIIGGLLLAAVLLVAGAADAAPN